MDDLGPPASLSFDHTLKVWSVECEIRGVIYCGAGSSPTRAMIDLQQRLSRIAKEDENASEE